MSRVLVTNVRDYTGPGAVAVLLREGHEVLCHDPSFSDEAARGAFGRDHPGAVALASRAPEAIAAELDSFGPLDGFVSNDVHPITERPIEDIALDDLRATESIQNRGGLVLARVRRGPADGARTGQRRCGG